MIFLTVGTQLPFDRLIKIVDTWNAGRNEKVIAQVGESEYESTDIEIFEHLNPIEFEKNIQNCRIIVSHSGMGSILTALKSRKPIIIFPRQASLGEHRNDHQLATAKSFQNTPGVYVAFNESELIDLLNSKAELTAGELVDSNAYSLLQKNIKTLLS
jgi:UDP-N-acetylglucosamine transferase subunit ALG13